MLTHVCCEWLFGEVMCLVWAKINWGKSWLIFSKLVQKEMRRNLKHELQMKSISKRSHLPWKSFVTSTNRSKDYMFLQNKLKARMKGVVEEEFFIVRKVYLDKISGLSPPCLHFLLRWSMFLPKCDKCMQQRGSFGGIPKRIRVES